MRNTVRLVMAQIHRLAVIAAMAIFATLGASAAHAEMQGATIITVTGAVSKPNRGPYDENRDKFLGYHEINFDKAHVFDLATLKAMPQVVVETDFPQGGPTQQFEGPALSTVLAAAGVDASAQVWMQALDGYAVEASAADLIDKGAVLALGRNGQAFGVGDFGPSQLVFPRGSKAGLDDMNDDLWIWSIFHIKAE